MKNNRRPCSKPNTLVLPFTSQNYFFSAEQTRMHNNITVHRSSAYSETQKKPATPNPRGCAHRYPLSRHNSIRLSRIPRYKPQGIVSHAPLAARYTRIGSRTRARTQATRKIQEERSDGKSMPRRRVSVPALITPGARQIFNTASCR